LGIGDDDKPLMLRSVWCIPASRTSKVLVLARYSDGPGGWGHLLHWTPRGGVEEGVWTKLTLVRHLCQVDTTGQFLKYEGRKKICRNWNDPTPEPFRASVGGAVAVSRAPWLSALTHIHGHGYLSESSGGGVSVHALSGRDQEVLWRTFPQRPDDVNWFAFQQPGWNDVHESKLGELRRQKLFLADTAWIGSRRCVENRELFACLPWKSFTHGDASSVRFAWRDGSGPLHFMKGVPWAWTTERGELLVAESSGLLRVLRPNEQRGTGSDGSWMDGWVVEEECDISKRVPNPGPSPAWARARLSRG
jgi:hypothetical protein